MRKDTHQDWRRTFAFSPPCSIRCWDNGAKGAARDAELAGAMHVSISSIKDGGAGRTPERLREGRGYRLLGTIDVADLLIESGDRTMDENSPKTSWIVLCVLWNQAYDFL